VSRVHRSISDRHTHCVASHAQVRAEHARTAAQSGHDLPAVITMRIGPRNYEEHY